MTPPRRAALLASVRDAQARFETGARILHRVLSQRSEQQESVLASLTALTQAGVADTALDEYASAMRVQYPRIVSVQRCRTHRHGP